MEEQRTEFDDADLVTGEAIALEVPVTSFVLRAVGAIIDLIAGSCSRWACSCWSPPSPGTAAWTPLPRPPWRSRPSSSPW